MNIGIGEGAYTRYGISEGARKAREHGYECFDFGRFVTTGTEFFLQSEENFKAELLEYKRLIEAEGMVVWQVHSPWRHPAQDFTPEDRAERLNAFLKAVRGAGYLGATHFVLHALMPFGTNSSENPEEMKNINAEFMKRLYVEAKEYGVKHICIENLPFPALPINHTYQCIEFAKRMNEETGSDMFKVCLDTGHSNFCGEKPADAVRLIGKDYLGALHVHDNDGKADQHAIPGRGNIDWEDFSNALAEIGFEGCVNFETSVPNSIPDGEERDAQEIELARWGLKIAKRT